LQVQRNGFKSLTTNMGPKEERLCCCVAGYQSVKRATTQIVARTKLASIRGKARTRKLMKPIGCPARSARPATVRFAEAPISVPLPPKQAPMARDHLRPPRGSLFQAGGRWYSSRCWRWPCFDTPLTGSFLTECGQHRRPSRSLHHNVTRPPPRPSKVPEPYLGRG
jgi:hypothetical protein